MGFPLTFNGPDSVEAYDQKAGRVGGCLEDAVDNTIYRSTLPEFQEAFVKVVEQLTGKTREVNTEATTAAKARSKTPDKVKDIMETVPRFVKRATAGMSEADLKTLAGEAQTVADTIEVDPSPSKRAAGISKDLKSKAESLLTQPTDQLEAKIAKWGDQYDIDITQLERDEATSKPTVDSLARLVGQVLDAKLAED